MARETMDIKESLSALVMRSRATQRCHEQRDLCGKEDPGNIAVREQLAPEHQPGGAQ